MHLDLCELICSLETLYLFHQLNVLSKFYREFLHAPNSQPKLNCFLNSGVHFWWGLATEKPLYLGRVMRKTTLPLNIKPTRHQIVLVEWNFVRESLNARYAAWETFPSIMISLHYFVIPSSTEFPTRTNRYTNAPAPIHTYLRNIAESSVAVRRNSDETCFSRGIMENFSLLNYTDVAKKIYHKNYYIIRNV